MSLYKQYPEYKDSGIAAVGLIPAGWDAERIDWLFSRRREDAVPGSERVTAYIDGRVTGRSNVDQKIKAVIKDEGWQKICAGDLAISGMNAHLGGIGVSDTNGQCSPIYLILKSKGAANPHYMGNLLRHYAATGFISSLVNTIRYNSSDFRADDLKNIWVALPSLAEQSSIIFWLDRESARIESLIAKKTRFIELLREKRQALITHAVTKGLDPNAKMKDSGVEWLGEVPEHWAPKQIQYVVAAIEQGWSPECLAEPAEESQWGVVKSGCVNGGVFATTENKRLPEGLEPRPELLIRRGDVLMSRASGSVDLIGSVAMVGNLVGNLMLSDKIFRITLKPIICKSFFTQVMSSSLIRSQIEIAVSGAEGLANNLPQSRIKKFWIALPALAEQLDISEYISRQAKRLDGIIEKTERSIELLKERRSALITAAVTGQIDLRTTEGT